MRRPYHNYCITNTSPLKNLKQACHFSPAISKQHLLKTKDLRLQVRSYVEAIDTILNPNKVQIFWERNKLILENLPISFDVAYILWTYSEVPIKLTGPIIQNIHTVLISWGSYLGMWYPDTWITGYMDIQAILAIHYPNIKKFEVSKYPCIHGIQVSMYPSIRIHKELRYPTIHVSKHWIVG